MTPEEELQYLAKMLAASKIEDTKRLLSIGLSVLILAGKEKLTDILDD